MGQYVRTPTDLGPQLLIHFPRDTTLLPLKPLRVLALVTLLSLTPPTPGGAQSPVCTFLHLVTQQEDLIPAKAAPRVSVYSADLELSGVGGT